MVHTSSSSSHALLRIATAHGLPEVLQELGKDPSKVIAELGLDPELFEQPDNRITLRARGKLLKHCATVCRCQHFGLLVGQRDGLATLGIVGLMARYAPDVGTALRRLVQHFHLHAHGVEVGLTVDGGRALFTYAIVENGVVGVDQAGDGAVAAQLNIMRELCGADFKPISAWFVRASPESVEPYRDFFRSRLRFGASTYGLEFSSSWLTRRLPRTDEEVAKLIAERVNKLELEETHGFPEAVQRVMQSSLAFNRAHASNVAPIFGLHVRNYHRQLGLAGTSHQELLDHTRMTLACRLLEYSSKDIAEIAELLGYSEPRSFIRAFKRWTAVTPARWRRK
jgi:AraC-like DNA-binding protein